jgi:hypothetical protein
MHFNLFSPLQQIFFPSGGKKWDTIDTTYQPMYVSQFQIQSQYEEVGVYDIIFVGVGGI